MIVLKKVGNMRNKIFVGGFGGSGTRVVQMILEKAGFYVGEKGFNINSGYDYGGGEFAPIFDKFHFNRTKEAEDAFKKYLDVSDRLKILGKENFSLKHGHLMFCISDLKEWFPGSSFILVVRHPVDNILNKCTLHIRYGREGLDCPLERKLDYYERTTREALKHADFLFRLEDVVFKTAETIKRLFDFVGIADGPEDYIGLVVRPDTIGRGRAVRIKNKIIRDLGYDLKVT